LAKTFDDSVVLLTGGNSGLGWALLNRLVHVVRKIYVLDIQVDNLSALAKNHPEKIVFYSIDIRQRGKVRSILTEIQSHNSIDIFINNAGITLIKPFSETEFHEFDRVMEVNFSSPAFMINVLINNGLKGVLTINSVAGFAPIYARSAYVASKHALEGLMKTLACETGISFMNVYPSFINTGIRTAAISEGKKSFKVQKKQLLDVDWVADKIISGWVKGKKNLFLGWMSWGSFLLMKFLPKLYHFLMMKQNRRLWQS
jgi:NAD(P)-dependent dehydrogenase (short-subunit alcohol dehydrogenase family)